MKYQEIIFRPNTLCHGDCLRILQTWAGQNHKVDLIYLDPPFNSSANYNILFGKDSKGNLLDERAQFVAFKDTWNWTDQADERVERLCGIPYKDVAKTMQGLKLMLGESGMLAYVSYMAERLIWMREILKDTGSIYFHCDPTASHYIKAVMDCIFGVENFRNEIVWGYRSGGASKKRWAKKHDVLFYYAKNSNTVFFAPQKETILYDKPFFNSEPNSDGNYPVQVLKRDVWDSGVRGNDQHLKPIINVSKERLGYPTQKPIALLERIVNASSNEGELVLDPFCGCGTTAEAAWKLKRNFIGVDISPYAITEVCRRRLKNAEGVTIQGLPMDLPSAADLGNTDPFAFEQWAVSCLPGFMPNEKQVGDGGIDGRGFLLNTPLDKDGKKLTRACIAQVKVSKPSPDAIRALLSQIIGGKAAIGVFITLKKLNITKTMQENISAAGTLTFAGGTEQHSRMLFWSIEEYFAEPKVFLKMPERGHPITGNPLQEEIR